MAVVVDPTIGLVREHRAFCEAIRQLPGDAFLEKMSGDDWSPRDVAAHLAGWNRHMLGACQAILAGKTPDYYADGPNDYRTINAGFVARHSSTSRDALLAELEAGLNALVAFAASLDRAEWEASHGVRHYRGGPASVAQTLGSLAGDYAHHTRQIEGWWQAQRPSPF